MCQHKCENILVVAIMLLNDIKFVRIPARMFDPALTIMTIEDGSLKSNALYSSPNQETLQCLSRT